MGLEYDFDIVAVAQDAIDPEHAKTAVTGAPAVRAQFRDIKTADALRGASPKIRRIFTESGFSLDTGEGGSPNGFYAPAEEEDRHRILRRLFANIRNMGVQGEYCGEFDFWQFLNHVRAAQPGTGPRQVEKARPMQRRRPPTEPSRPNRQTVPGRIGFALGLAVIVFVALKYLAEQGATP
ncbi:hypothetical protein RA28_11380 [Ruegeria sp. ANG-S4]|nr:hypothetical protein RA28_11380 [Ruegeria sp. ANG-S4]